MKECPICKQDLVPDNKQINWLSCPQGHYLYNWYNGRIFFGLKDYRIIIYSDRIVVRHLTENEIIFTLNEVIDFDWDKLDNLNERIKKLVPFS